MLQFIGVGRSVLACPTSLITAPKSIIATHDFVFDCLCCSASVYVSPIRGDISIDERGDRKASGQIQANESEYVKGLSKKGYTHRHYENKSERRNQFRVLLLI